MNDNRFELLLFCPTDSIREAMEQSNPWTNKQTNFFVHHLSYQKISDLKRLFEILDRYLAKNFEFGLVKIGDPMNDNRFELLLFWPPLTHISLLLPGFCSTLWCEFLFVYKLYGPLAFSIHFHSLNLKLLVKLILSRHAKKREAKPPLRIIRIVTQSWGEFSTAGDENSVKKYRPKFSPDNFSCIDQSTYTTSSFGKQ